MTTFIGTQRIWSLLDTNPLIADTQTEMSTDNKCRLKFISRANQ